MLDAFGEICLNLVFLIVVVKSIIWCLSCDFDESIIWCFSHRSLVKEMAATSEKVKIFIVVTLLVTAEREAGLFLC